MRVFAVATLVTLIVASAAAAGGPGGGGGASMIAAKICAAIKQDVGAARFRHHFPSPDACTRKQQAVAAAAMRDCMSKTSPGSAAWRDCIQAHVTAAAKAYARHAP